MTESHDLREDGGTVHVAAANVRYYTAALDSTQVHVLQRLADSQLKLDGGDGDGGGTTSSGDGGDGCDDGCDGGGSSGGDGGDDDEEDDIWESAEPATAPPPSARLVGACAHLGRVRVTLRTAGFYKIWHKTGEVFEEVGAFTGAPRSP